MNQFAALRGLKRSRKAENQGEGAKADGGGDEVGGGSPWRGRGMDVSDAQTTNSNVSLPDAVEKRPRLKSDNDSNGDTIVKLQSPPSTFIPTTHNTIVAEDGSIALLCMAPGEVCR
ncbi:hypothetical protein HDV05_003000 [Chytridiales sp. JEL 0842]|nr:hypothetical protein HDV05_003000 [Chytridiales sp. JEL 0842]